MIHVIFSIIKSIILYSINIYTYDIFISQILNDLVKHNIIFIKVFQALSSNNLFSLYLNNKLKNYTNHANFYETDVDTKLLLHILDAYDIELYDTRPINAGMIALAYKGYIRKSNKIVCIKMKRLNIEERITCGYNEFKYFYNMLKFISGYFGFNDIVNSLSSFIESENYIISQCDFQNEITVLKRMKREINNIFEEHQLKSLDKIVIPNVYNFLSETNENNENNETNDFENQYIVMDFLEGTSCFEVENKYDCLYTLSTFVFTNILLISLFHTDLHPGNIICMPEGKLGIIDFGMSIELTVNLKNGLINISQLLLTKKTNKKNEKNEKTDYLQSFKNMLEPKLDTSILTTNEYAEINSILEELFTNLYSGKLTEYDIHMYLKKLYNSNEKFKNYKISLDCIKMLLGYTMFNASLLSLTTDTNLINQIQEEILTDIFT